MGDNFEEYPQPARVRRTATSRLVISGSESGSDWGSESRFFDEGSETVDHDDRRPRSRIVDQARATYEEISMLIGALARRHKVNIDVAPQAKRGQTAERQSMSTLVDEWKGKIPDLHFPETVPFSEYDGDPAASPVVAKNETVSMGKQKYFIESREQLDRLRDWMAQHGNPKHWLMQQYIESPGESPSTYRVLVDCTGHIVTSQLSYGPPKKEGLRLNGAQHRRDDDPSRFLETPGNKHFLDARAIASNTMILHQNDTTTGGRITLNPLPISHPYSKVEKQLLKDHGLHQEQPVLPPEIVKVASAIGREMGMEGDQIHELLLGLDFVQDKHTGRHYFLEANRRPSLAPVRDMLGSANAVAEIQAWQWVINEAMNRVAQMRQR